MEYLRKIKDYCDAHGIKVFLHVCALPQVTLDAIPDIPALREAAHKLGATVGIPLIDGFSFPDATDNSHFGDAFGHLASDYRQTYAKYMAEAMKPYLEPKSKGPHSQEQQKKRTSDRPKPQARI